MAHAFVQERCTRLRSIHGCYTSYGVSSPARTLTPVNLGCWPFRDFFASLLVVVVDGLASSASPELENGVGVKMHAAPELHRAHFKNNWKSRFQISKKIKINLFEYIYTSSMHGTSFVEICYYLWPTKKKDKSGIKNKLFYHFSELIFWIFCVVQNSGYFYSKLCKSVDNINMYPHV
jgi:hypothetical protein